jgi:hypothetical protein
MKMTDQSHRDEMNAAIRAQRERHAAPRTIAPEPFSTASIERGPPLEPQSQKAERPKTLFQRLRGK